MTDNPSWGTSIKKVIIMEGVTSIGYGAFDFCPDLTSVMIPNTVTTIGAGAFGYGSSLTSVTLPSSLISIEPQAFLGCSSLTNVTIPNSVTSIGISAFGLCTSLKSVTIGKGITSIGNNTFEGCSSLTSVAFTGNAPTFGDNVFYNDTLTAQYPADNDTWTNDVMQQYGGTVTWEPYTPVEILDSGTCGENLTWTLSDGGTLTISGTGAMTNYYASPWNTSVKKVIITEGVTSIGEKAFNFCSSLESVTIPNSVTNIGHYAFYRCSSLTSVTIQSGTIGNKAFAGCSSLACVTIQNGVTTIGIEAFLDCESLTNVEIPDSVTNIGDWAFAACKSLTGISVNESNPNYASVDGILFNKDYTSLITYPAGKTAASYAIPSSVTDITGNAFNSCSHLTAVTIPNSVTTIEVNAFAFCSSLMSIVIPDSVTDFGRGGQFYGCTSLRSVTIGKGVTSIGGSTFSGCSSLTSVTFNGNAPTFGDNVFYNDTLTAEYPANNATWTNDVMQQYGGTVTWKAYSSKELDDNGVDVTSLDCAWGTFTGKQYWYENGTRQGTYDDANGVIGDGTVRGREIFDPASDGWYWLDACYEGAKAVSKEVWMPYIYQNEATWDDSERWSNSNASDSGMARQVHDSIENGSGKWVRYNADGKMYKGWCTITATDEFSYCQNQLGNTYYYDTKTGLMAKGYLTINGVTYHFDETTGVLLN